MHSYPSVVKSPHLFQVKVPDKQYFTQVFYVDYGTVATVKRNTIRFLPKIFSQLPAQAMRAKLYGIKPAGKLKKWPKTTNLQFLKLVTMPPPNIGGMWAQIKGLPATHDRLVLWLVDTQSNDLPEGIVVNKVCLKTYVFSIKT